MRVYKEAGRPLPQFSEDDVTDFMVTEAIIIKSLREEEEAREKVERTHWKKDIDGLKEAIGPSS